MKTKVGLLLCETADKIIKIGNLKSMKCELYPSLYRKFFTLIFNIRIHNVNDATYLETFFKKVQVLSTLSLQTVTDANVIYYYLKQILSFQHHVQSSTVVDDASSSSSSLSSLSELYINLLLLYARVANKVNPAFPYEQCKQSINITHIVTTITSFIDAAIAKQHLFLTSPMQFGIHNANAVMCIKRDLLLQSLSVYYKDIFFYNEAFIKLRQLYNITVIKQSFTNAASNTHLTVYDEKNVNLCYPVTIRNYSSATWFTPKVFFKHDLNFFRSDNFNVTHSYCSCCREYYTKRSKPLLTHSIDVNENNGLLFYDNVVLSDDVDCRFECDLIGYSVYFGVVVFTSKYFVFASASTTPNAVEDEKYLFTSENTEYEVNKCKQLIILYTEIEEVMQRRFLYMNQAVEVFLKNGKSYLFNFLKVDLCERVLTLFKHIKDSSTALMSLSNREITYTLITDPKKHFNDSNIKSKWEQEQLDTFQYLLLINKHASRSYNDLNQYPIIPWPFILANTNIISKYKITDNTNTPLTTSLDVYPCIRHLEYPITVQFDDKLKVAMDMYNTSFQDNSKYGHHFRLHYSTSAYVIFYLARMYPYTSLQIKLQAGKFDSPNRQFNSIDSLLEILFDNFDNRELIPELLTSCEYFYNTNCAAFGRRTSDKLLVNHLMLPSSQFKSPCDFVMTLRWTLNTLLKDRIHKWIDIIFGEKQFAEKGKKDGVFLYPKSTYAQKMNLLMKVEKYRNKEYDLTEIASKVMNVKMKVLCFGQTPLKLFDTAHSRWEKEENNEEKKEDEFSEIERLTSGGIKFTTKVDKNQHVLYFSFTSEKDNVYIVKKKYPSTDNGDNNVNASMYEIEIPSTAQSKKRNNTVIPIQKMKFFKYYITSSTHNNVNNNSNSFNNGTSLYNNSHNKNFTYVLLPQYAMFDLFNGEYFVTCRNNNNQIIIYQSNTVNTKDTSNVKGYIYKAITTHSFVSVVYQITNTTFISGHHNGRIIEWFIDVKHHHHHQHKRKRKDKGIADVDMDFIIKRDILAHDNAMITAVTYNNVHNIILTCAVDGNIHIRKYYDFELLNVITVDKSTDMFNYVHVSNYDLIYATFINKKGGNGSYLACYTLNGIKVANLIDNYVYTSSNANTHCCNTGNTSNNAKTPITQSILDTTDTTTNASTPSLTPNTSSLSLTAPTRKLTTQSTTTTATTKLNIDDAYIKTRKIHISIHGRVIVCIGNEKLYIFNGANLSERTRYIPEDNKTSSNKKIMNFIYNEENNLMYCLYEDNEITRITNDDLQNKMLRKSFIELYNIDSSKTKESKSG